ncbi:hypothetical protein B0H17DRAFT_876413, partial [Mycena rosella]
PCPLRPSRLGSKDVTCTSKPRDFANTGVCRKLIVTLNDDTTIGEGQRAVCIGQGSKQCCTSWGKPGGDMPEAFLFPAAKQIFASCFNVAFGSAFAHNVNLNLNGQCATQYLSNRPNGCS